MLWFLYHLWSLHFTHTRPTTDLQLHTIHCDNEGIVSKINNLRSYKKIYPNATMDSEWDILAEIRTSLHLLPNSPTIDHIKGHQDQDKNYNKLSLAAQLNCDADHAAAQFWQDNPNNQFQIAPVLPSSGCQLQLSTGTVTYNFKPELKLARTLHPLRDCLCHQHGWTTSIFNDIDWTSHGRALQRHDKHRVTMVKNLHDCLPLRKLIHKYDPKYPESCPSCGTSREDIQHFWTCPSANRNKWRQACCRSVKQYLQNTGTALEL